MRMSFYLCFANCSFSLDAQHHAILSALGHRYRAPIKNPKKAIDIGTGTGIWMFEMAAEFPDCEFLGIDIFPLPKNAVLPKNCTFEIANAFEGKHNVNF
jgi:tRNA G46 methylase TrmB